MDDIPAFGSVHDRARSWDSTKQNVGILICFGTYRHMVFHVENIKLVLQYLFINYENTKNHV